MINMQTIVKTLEELGGSFATTNKFRHPTQIPFIKPQTNGRDILDTDKIAKEIEKTLSFVEECGSKGLVILFVSSRHESLDLIKKTAETLSLPHMTERWIGGTLSNFRNIRSRVEKMIQMKKDEESDAWNKYTKKERVLLNRELGKLETRFLGIENMTHVPAIMFVVDVKREKNAVEEANALNIPVIGFSNADADLNKIQYPITANIASRKTVEYVLSLVEEAYNKGVKSKK